MNSNFFDLSRNKKRDILSDLLADRPTDGLVSKKELQALYNLVGRIYQNETEINNKTSRRKTRTAAGEVRKKKRKRATYYLSEEVFQNLNNATARIRSHVPVNLRSKISKSKVVDQALFLMLREYELEGENSRLFRSIIK